MMKRLLFVILTLLPAAVYAQPPWGDVIEVLDNNDFEQGYTPGNWKFRMDAEIVSGNPYSGQLSAHVGGVGSLGIIEQKIDLSECAPGDVWVRAPYDMIPSSMPWPDDQWGRDVSNGWIVNGSGTVAELWERYDYNWDLNPVGYFDAWYRVVGLFDACGVNDCSLKISGYNDGGEKSIDWFWDDVEFFCLAQGTTDHRVYLPSVRR